MAQEQKFDINETILTGMDILVSKRLEDLDYDKTIIATIVNADNSSAGAYTVSDGATEFEAYSENTSFVEKDQVYVTVPKGDFTQQKIIISKYVPNADTGPVAYVSPLNRVYIISDNIVKSGKLINNTILANGREERVYPEGDSNPSIVELPPGAKRLIWEQDLELTKDNIVKNNSIFDVLAVKVGFTCQIGTSYNVTAGNYGISIKLTYIQDSDLDNPPSQSIEYQLDAKSMIGNPYYFLSNSIQEKRIDIGNIGTIKKIEVYLYQDGDFEYFDNNSGQVLDLPVDPPDKRLQIDDSKNNIKVNNLEVYFGVDTTKMNDDTFQIYTSSASSFDITKDDAYNTKTIIPIWFNKGEGDKYLGYSDGIYDYYDSLEDLVGHDYTEDKYLEQAKYYEVGSSLMTVDLAEEGIPSILELLAAYKYGHDVVKKLDELYVKIAVNMANCYNKLYDECARYMNDTPASNNAPSDKAYCKALIQSLISDDGPNGHATITSLLDKYRNIDSNVTDSYLYYLGKCLKRFGTWYSSNSSFSLTTANSFMNNNDEGLYKIIQSLKSKFNAYVNNVGEDDPGSQLLSVFERFKLKLDNANSLSYTTWINTWKELVKQCNALFDEIFSLIGHFDQYELLNNENDLVIDSGIEQESIRYQIASAYKKFKIAKENNTNLITFEAEHSAFIAQYNNRYCIYWYKYEDGADVDNFMPKNWRRLEDYTNQGLPDSYHQDDDLNFYYDIRPSSPEVNITVGNASVRSERIQAVLIYNHQVYKSNVLTFYNDQPVVDSTTVGLTKGLYISLTNAELDDNGALDMSTDTYYTKETYQLYGMNNYLVNSAEGNKKRRIRARFRSDMTTDEYLRRDCILYWYVPIHSTMLTVSVNDLIAAGYSCYCPATENFVNGLEDNVYKSIITPPSQPYIDEYRSGYIMVYRQTGTLADNTLDPVSTELIYQIKDYYVPTATNNTIHCRVIKNGVYRYDADQSFTFASFGTNGTDYSLVILPTKEQVALQDNSPLNLSVKLFDTNGEDITLEYASKITCDLNSVYFQRNLSNDKPAYVTTNYPTVTLTRAPMSGTFEGAIDYQYSVLEASTKVEIEYQQLEKEENDTGKEERPSRSVNLKAYYPIPWSKDPSEGHPQGYYIEGPSVVVYDTNGANPKYYEDPFVLYDKKTSKKIEGQKWGIGYVTTDSNKTTSTLIREYMPKLKEGTDGFRLTVSNMYLSNNNWYCYVYCYINTLSTDNLLWVQPIYITQNRFASPMMNAWDGELTIDKENGTILSSMVGAGRKENDNSFTGVLMGEVNGKYEDIDGINKNKTGLYGYHHGEQSFGFQDDGTSFIGKSGRGRIVFDGNSGKIKSQSWDQGTPKTGMMIDLDDGEIDIKGGYETALQSQGTYNNEQESQFYIDGTNRTRYSGTGSRVHIQVKDPYFTITSPEVVYTDETTWQSTISTFWNGIEYQKNAAAWKQYLTEYFGLKVGTQKYDNTIKVKKLNGNYNFFDSGNNGKAVSTIKTNLNTYYEVVEDLTFQDLNTNTGGLWDKVEVSDFFQQKQPGTETGVTVDIHGLPVYNVIIPSGSFIYVESENKFQVIVKGEDVFNNIKSYPTPAEVDDGCFVNQFGVKITVLGKQQNNYTIPDLSEESGNTLMDKLVNKILTYKTNPLANDNSLSYLIKQNGEYNEFTTTSSTIVTTVPQIILLKPEDYKTALMLYTKTKQAKDLMHVGLSEYYLQTDNYRKGTSAQNYADGAGVKFDLMKGTLDGYNFTLTAADPETGNNIRLSSSSPFFKIQYNQAINNDGSKWAGRIIDLINIGNSNYLLQSQNWYPQNSNYEGEGTKLDMVNGKITSYNFTLDARTYKKNSSNKLVPNDGFILSSTGSPYFQVINNGVYLFDVAKDKFLLQSKDWYENKNSPSQNRGLQINLNEGKITSYSNFTLTAYDNSWESENVPTKHFGSFITLSSSGNPYFQINYKDTSTYQRHQTPTDGGVYVTYGSSNGLGSNAIYSNLVTCYKLNANSNDTYSTVAEENIELEDSEKDNYYKKLYILKLDSSLGLWYPKIVIDSTVDESKTYYTYSSGRYLKVSGTPDLSSTTSYYEEVQVDGSGNTFESKLKNFYLKDRAYYSSTSTLSNNLIYINQDSYYLRSQNYLANYQGLQFNLKTGELTSWSHFNLYAKNSQEGDQYQGSYVQLSSSGSPYLRVHYRRSDIENEIFQELNLLDITKSTFVLRSHDWKKPSKQSNGASTDYDGMTGAGMQIDIAGGEIQSYGKFDLYACNSDVESSNYGSYIRFSNQGTSKMPYFRVENHNSDILIPLTSTEVLTSDYEPLEVEHDEAYVTNLPHFNYRYIQFYTKNGSKYNAVTDASDIDSSNFTNYYGRLLRSDISGEQIYRLATTTSYSASYQYISIRSDGNYEKANYTEAQINTLVENNTPVYFLRKVPLARPVNQGETCYLNNRFYSPNEVYFLMSRTQEIKLMDITKTTFVLHSQNWVSGQSGTEFNVAAGTLKSYDFNLVAKNRTIGSQYINSKLELSSNGEPFLRITHKNTTGNVSVNIVEITNENFYLRSHNWKSGVSGTEFNMNTGHFVAYDKDGSKLRYVKIDSNAERYPFVITDNSVVNEGTDSNQTIINLSAAPMTRIKWDGTLETSYINAVGGYIGGWRMDTTDLWTGQNASNTTDSKDVNTTFRLAAGSFGRAIEGFPLAEYPDTAYLKIAIGKKFAVDYNGVLYSQGGNFAGTIIASGGNIGDWVIGTGLEHATNAGTYLRPNGLAVNNSFTVDKDGNVVCNNITAHSGKIGDWDLGSSSSGTVGTSGYTGSLSGGSMSAGTISGGTINGSTIKGSTILGGTLDIGGNPSAAGTGNFRVYSTGAFQISDGTKFKVTSTGELTADGAKLTGTCEAEEFKMTVPAGTDQILTPKTVNVITSLGLEAAATLTLESGTGTGKQHLTAKTKDLSLTIDSISIGISGGGGGGASASGTRSFVTSIGAGYEAGANNVQIGDNYIHYYTSTGVTGVSGGGASAPTLVLNPSSGGIDIPITGKVSDDCDVVGEVDVDLELTPGTDDNESVFEEVTYIGLDPEKVSGGCFAPGSKVLLSDYTEINIEDIKVGDSIISYNELFKTYESDIVYRITQYDNKHVVDIIFSDGTLITMTPSHPIYTNEGWVALDIDEAWREHNVLVNKLRIGQYINNKQIVNIIDNNIVLDKVYNLSVANNHTYVVNNVPVHNAAVVHIVK